MQASLEDKQKSGVARYADFLIRFPLANRHLCLSTARIYRYGRTKSRSYQ